MLASRVGQWGKVIKAGAVQDYGYSQFLDAWSDEHGTEPVRAVDLMPLAGLLLNPPEKPHALSKVLSRMSGCGLVRKSAGRSAKGAPTTDAAIAAIAIARVTPAG